jgi:hypothetical protein
MGNKWEWLKSFKHSNEVKNRKWISSYLNESKIYSDLRQSGIKFPL